MRGQQRPPPAAPAAVCRGRYSTHSIFQRGRFEGPRVVPNRPLDAAHGRQALIDSLRDAFASGAMVIEASGEALREVSSDRLSLIVDNALARLREAALLVD